jgi:hypothetical protein
MKQAEKGSFRRSVWDPIVLAAALGLAGTIGVKIGDEIGQDGRARVEAQAEAENQDCDRAFDYVKLAATVKGLQQDAELLALNRDTVKRCSQLGLSSLDSEDRKVP